MYSGSSLEPERGGAVVLVLVEPRARVRAKLGLLGRVVEVQGGLSWSGVDGARAM